MDNIKILLEIWRLVIVAILKSGDPQKKVDKKGREFTSYSFVDLDKRGTYPQSVVVYTDKKGNVTLLVNVSVLRYDGNRYPRSVKFFLKSLNQEKFFLISGKTRMFDWNKSDYQEFFGNA